MFHWQSISDVFQTHMSGPGIAVLIWSVCTLHNHVDVSESPY